MTVINLNPDDKTILDVAAILTGILGFVTNLMPTIVLILTAVYTVIRIYETTTVQRFLGKEVSNGEDSKSE